MLFLVDAKLVQAIICARIRPYFLLWISFNYRWSLLVMLHHRISAIWSENRRFLVFCLPIIGLIGSIWARPDIFRIDWINHDWIWHTFKILILRLIFLTWLRSKLHERSCILFSIKFILEVSFSGRFIIILSQEMIFLLQRRRVIDLVSVLKAFMVQTLVEIQWLAR